MRKLLKIIVSLFSALILTALMVPVLLSILLSSHTVQNRVADRLARLATDRLGTPVSVDRVRMRLFNRAVVEGFYVQDYAGDTLLYVRSLDAGVKGYNPLTGVVRLGDVRLDGAKFYLSQDSTGTMNLKYVTEKLKSDKPKRNRKPLRLRAGSLRVTDTRFKLRKYVVPDKPYGVNFADLDVRGIDMDVQAVRMHGDSIGASLQSLAFAEKSGFVCRRLSASRVTVAGSGMTLDDLTVVDPYSDIRMERLRFDYPAWKAYKDFVRQVEMHATLKPSLVSFRTIACFAPSLREWKSVLDVKGTVDGTVSDLAGDLTRVATRDTELALKFRIDGLPDIRETVFTFDIPELQTTAPDIDYLYGDITGKSLGKTAATLERMGRIRLEGRFHGLLSNFTADGSLSGEPGGSRFDVRLQPDTMGLTRMNGRVWFDRFGLGELLGSPKLGEVTVTAAVDGFLNRDSLALNTQATVAQLRYNGYDYRDIGLDGEVRNRYFRGFVGSHGPNIPFRVNGTFDFNGSVPRYDFDLDLHRADLRRLRLNLRDSVSVLSGRIMANAVGSNLNDINGSGSIRNLFYRFNADTVQTAEIRFLGNNNGNVKQLSVRSDLLDAELRSRLSIYDLIPYFRQTIRNYLPSLPAPDTSRNRELEAALDRAQDNSADNYYIVKATVKKGGSFPAAFLPALSIADGTTLSFLFNPATDNFSLTLDSELIEYKNMYVAGLSLTNRNQSDSVAVYLRTEEAGVGNFYMPELAVIGGARSNVVNLGAGFSNRENGTSALLNTTSRLTLDPETGSSALDIRFNTSQISVGDRMWRVVSPRITVGGGTVDIERFRLLSQGQELAVSGRLSKTESDTLHLAMKEFDLSPLSGLIDRYGYRVEGRTNGSAEIVGPAGERLFYSQLGFRDIRVNDKPLPNSTFSSRWDPETRRIRLSLATADETLVTGGYRPSDKRYFVNIDFPRLDLSFLQPVLGTVLTGIEGEGNARLVLTGTGARPLLNGTIAVPRFAGTVDFTKVRYRIDDAVIDVQNNDLVMRKTKVRDERNGEGDFEMALRTTWLSDLRYDIRLTPDRLLALNTTEKDNDLFYGTAYASGTVGIRGDKRSVTMDIAATTENNSAFYMPLNDKASIAEADFIVFEDPNRKRDTVPGVRERLIQRLRKRRERTDRKSDLDINMLLNVRPNTEIQLVIDPKIGDVIKANGTGSLNLHVRPAEELFTMYGDYEINEGSYLFTLMNVLNKRFTIERGSTIQWTGDPVDALLNITATYRVRASLAPLMNDEKGYRQNVPVDCNLILTDRLTQPTISFDVKVPTADAEIRSIVQSALNTQELKSTQFMWLLATNSFYNDNSTTSSSFNIGTTTTAVTGIEFLSNQLSNWISSDRFSFNFGYRPKSEVSSDEYDFSMAYEVIPNKLIVEGEGNYNTGNNGAMTERGNNALTGDFAVTYIFDRLGNLRAKGFTRTIDRFDENQGLQESGLGLYYKRDFDTFRDLFRRRKRRAVPLLPALPADSVQRALPTEPVKTPVVSAKP